MDPQTISMNSIEFGFITQQISASSFDWQTQIDFICKCYNLFLLFFYFNICKFVITEVRHWFRGK